MIPASTWEEAKGAFAAGYPHEVVVAIWEDGTWKQFENIHPHPVNAFELSTADTAALRDRPPHVFLHSHCHGNPDPSDIDSLQQLATGWTWGVVLVEGRSVTDKDGQEVHEVTRIHEPRLWGDAVPVQPLLGRRYAWTTSDCFSLMRDHHRLDGIMFDDVPRVRDPHIKGDDEKPVYPSNHWAHRYFEHWIPRLGFKAVERHARRPGDVCVRRNGSTHLNHCAVYLGEGKYLDITIERTSFEYIPPHEERWMSLVGARFYRHRSRK